MPMIQACHLRRGDTILTSDGTPPKEIMRASTEPFGVTEIKFADGTRRLALPTDRLPVMTRS